MEVNYRESIDTEELVIKFMPYLSEDQMEQYVKQIGKILQKFEVKYKESSWMVIRSHHDIQDFILQYNLKFKAKLQFGSFMMQGVKDICLNQAAVNWQHSINFFQIKDSQLNKVKSIRLQKKSGGRYKDYLCCRLPWQWKTRDFVITTSGVLYFSEGSKEPKEYLPFGNGFKIFKGKKQTGYEFGIRLEASHRKLLLFATNVAQFFQFIYFIHEAQEKAVYALGHKYRYDSFAPQRPQNKIQFLIDGQVYFRAVADALQRAKWQILICGWMISPQFYLIRPISQNIKFRLDQCLKRAAGRGIKIFILVYNESSFLTNDSSYTKQALQCLSTNIKVLQHPLGVLPTFWSHHQKAVIVDQSECLLGGLDLCYARYDTSAHLINHNDPQYYPGIQYNNIRSVDLTKVRQFWKDSIDRNRTRMPWHDVGLRVMGESVLDICHHFIQYWNYASFQTHYEDRYILILEKEKPKQPLMKRIQHGITRQFRNLKHFAGSIKNKMFKREQKDQRQQTETVKSDQIKLQIKPDQAESENNSTKYFHPSRQKSEETWNQNLVQSKSSKKSNGNSNPLSDQQSQQSEKPIQFKMEKKKRRFSTVAELDNIVQQMEDLVSENIEFINDIQATRKRSVSMQQINEEEQQNYNCQVLRSVGSWSIGCSQGLIQKSIYAAYVDLILNARYYIYIQNQFFISSVKGNQTVKNQIAQALLTRIIRAHSQKQMFRVYVLLPLIPGFAGQLDDPDAVLPRVLMYWQYHSICRSETSLLSRLLEEGIQASNYISFYGLRTHGQLEQNIHTQIIYLHSKLMIVDDSHAICGSANINDRSMRGSRDSQLCLLVSGGPKITVKMGDINCEVSEIIHDLRVNLFKQHFGNDIEPADPLNQICVEKINMRARINTQLYHEIFHCYPDDTVNTLAELVQFRSKKINQKLYWEMKDDIKGNVVQFPLNFLKDEDLLIGSTLYPDALSV